MNVIVMSLLEVRENISLEKKIWKEAPGKIVWRRKSMNKLTRAFLNLMAPGLIIRITRIGIKPKICSVLFWNIHKKIIWKCSKSFFWKKEESRKFQMYLYFPLSFLFLFYFLFFFLSAKFISIKSKFLVLWSGENVI